MPVPGCDGDDVASDPNDGGRAQMQCGPAGQSMACTGPGGCDGAQVCRADGSYGECDCGSDAASDCAPAGIVAACIGDGGCNGHQVCGESGAFGACECNEAAGGGVTALDISSPSAGETVSGTFEVTGTAEGGIVAVAVSIAGGPPLLAEGTESWSLTYDVSDLDDGLLTIAAAATGEDSEQLRRWLQVRVQNVDPLVGSWFRTQPEYQPDEPWTYCMVAFFANGALDLASDCPPGGGSRRENAWQRESGDIIRFGGGRDPLTLVVAVLSADGETLELIHDPEYSEIFARVHDDPPPLIDPSDLDGGAQ